jgi:hypothetical protein
MSDDFDPRRPHSTVVNPIFKVGMNGHDSADVYDEFREFIESVDGASELPIDFKDATYLIAWIIEEYGEEIIADFEEASRDEIKARVEAIEGRRNEPSPEELLDDLQDDVTDRDDVDREDVEAAIESFRAEVDGGDGDDE